MAVSVPVSVYVSVSMTNTEKDTRREGWALGLKAGAHTIPHHTRVACSKAILDLCGDIDSNLGTSISIPRRVTVCQPHMCHAKEQTKATILLSKHTVQPSSLHEHHHTTNTCTRTHTHTHAHARFFTRPCRRNPRQRNGHP